MVSRKVWTCCAMEHEDGPPQVWMDLIHLKIQEAEGDGSSS